MSNADTGAGQGETMGARVLDQVLALISTGELAPGQRLVEQAIARRLGVSTVPVREALRILAGDGAVEILPHKGATLRLMDPREIGDTLKGIVGLLMVAFDELEHAPDRMDLAELARITGVIQVALDNRQGLAALNAMADFQLSLIRSSGNRYIERSIRKVHFINYNTQVLRYISAEDLLGVGASHAQSLARLRTGAFAPVRAQFRDNVAHVCTLLRRHENQG